jgi:succinyl-diaminopimelate desuccinylase
MTLPYTPLSLTQKLISFNTVDPPGLERDCAEFLGKLLQEGQFSVNYYEFEEKRTSLVAEREGRGDKAPICFSGHIDTVPLGEAAWSKDPFGGEFDGDKIYGRGSSDMKGGIAAMVCAALRLAALSRGNAGIVLVFTAGEETGCHGAYHLARLGNVLGKAGALIVGEPTSNYPALGHKGAFWLKAHTSGVTAHGSMPERGDNAIYKAARAVTALENFDFNVSQHPILGLPTLNVGTITGGININTVPDRATITIDIRTIPGQSSSKIFQNLQSVLGEDVELECITDAGSLSSDPQNTWIQEVFEILESYLEERPEPWGVTYFTDASALTAAFGSPPTLILGPGETTMAHKTDEYCYVSKLESATEIYLEIARRWCEL